MNISSQPLTKLYFIFILRCPSFSFCVFFAIVFFESLFAAGGTQSFANPHRRGRACWLLASPCQPNIAPEHSSFFFGIHPLCIFNPLVRCGPFLAFDMNFFHCWIRNGLIIRENNSGTFSVSGVFFCDFPMKIVSTYSKSVNFWSSLCPCTRKIRGSFPCRWGCPCFRDLPLHGGGAPFYWGGGLPPRKKINANFQCLQCKVGFLRHTHRVFSSGKRPFLCTSRISFCVIVYFGNLGSGSLLFWLGWFDPTLGHYQFRCVSSSKISGSVGIRANEVIGFNWFQWLVTDFLQIPFRISPNPASYRAWCILFFIEIAVAVRTLSIYEFPSK